MVEAGAMARYGSIWNPRSMTAMSPLAMLMSFPGLALATEDWDRRISLW